MRNVVDYKIVKVAYCRFTDTAEDLEKEVMKYIQDGYEPVGGVSLDTTGSVYRMTQAVAKYEVM